jgi:hypothetical protein
MGLLLFSHVRRQPRRNHHTQIKREEERVWKRGGLFAMSYTNPTYLAIRSGVSASQAVARQRTLKLYRDFQRCVRIPMPIYVG